MTKGVLKHPIPVPTRSPIHFIQRLNKHNEEVTISKFFNLIKQVTINVHLIDMLHVIIQYSNYLKDRVAKKKRLAEYATVAMIE